ncbi:MAG: AmmeMemoRadiSam system radical SAM enzyme [Euryarchaeota archaeon]|nr:AmmeMemoRadiSam system radical SAM enzyme [Euryarchaeota archaeon]
MEGLVPALLYERADGEVRCNLCERRCRVPEGERGFCGVRTNLGGRLYTASYTRISAVEMRPVEIKPFYHFHPASQALTFSSWGCNLSCMWCQNWHLSRSRPPERSEPLPPEEMLRLALRLGAQGTCVSFNEPTLLFEYCLELFPLARGRGLYNSFVSNGYMTEEALRMLVDAGLDAINIDIKGDDEVYRRYCGGARAGVVWRNISLARRLGVHLEVVNLVVTGVNDAEEDLRYVVENHLRHAGEEVPLHFTRYHPAHRFSAPPTPVERLEFARELARREGVLYPYIGNVPGHRYESTYCHACGRLLIRRRGYRVLEYRISGDRRCPRCGAEVPLTGRFHG